MRFQLWGHQNSPSVHQYTQSLAPHSIVTTTAHHNQAPPQKNEKGKNSLESNTGHRDHTKLQCVLTLSMRPRVQPYLFVRTKMFACPGNTKEEHLPFKPLPTLCVSPSGVLPQKGFLEHPKIYAQIPSDRRHPPLQGCALASTACMRILTLIYKPRLQKTPSYYYGRITISHPRRE